MQISSTLYTQQAKGYFKLLLEAHHQLVKQDAEEKLLATTNPGIDVMTETEIATETGRCVNDKNVIENGRGRGQRDIAGRGHPWGGGQERGHQEGHPEGQRDWCLDMLSVLPKHL